MTRTPAILAACLSAIAAPLAAYNDQGPAFHASVGAVDLVAAALTVGLVIGVIWSLWRLIRFVFAFLGYHTARYEARRRFEYVDAATWAARAEAINKRQTSRR